MEAPVPLAASPRLKSPRRKPTSKLANLRLIWSKQLRERHPELTGSPSDVVDTYLDYIETECNNEIGGWPMRRPKPAWPPTGPPTWKPLCWPLGLPSPSLPGGSGSHVSAGQQLLREERPARRGLARRCKGDLTPYSTRRRGDVPSTLRLWCSTDHNRHGPYP